MVTLVTTISSSSTICGQSPSNMIMRFCTAKVHPYYPTVVSEPTLFGFAPIDSAMV